VHRPGLGSNRALAEQKANAWYAQQPWLVGSNYVPKSAINQLEMWQEATFDPDEIDKELSWAEAMGMNTMRVFLQRLALAAGCRRFSEAHRPVLDHRVAASYPSHVCALRFLLGSVAASGSVASADSGGSHSGWHRVRVRRRWRTQINIRA